MLSKLKFSYKKHNHLAAITVVMYLFTMFSYIFYEINFNLIWFKAGYIANATGVIIALFAYIPHVTYVFKTNEKFSLIRIAEPMLGIISIFPFLFTWVMQCDQWEEVQPYMGNSIMLIIFSIAIIAVAFIIGLIKNDSQEYEYNSFRDLPIDY
jgi:hypothetical protein